MTGQKLQQILLIEDNPGDARLLREMLDEEGLRDSGLTQAECMKEAERLLAARKFDIVLLDLGLPEAQGFLFSRPLPPTEFVGLLATGLPGRRGAGARRRRTTRDAGRLATEAISW
jgi:CheY-like chemotaxis protein